MPTDESKPTPPWRRMPGETEKAYAAFVAFRDGGHGRSPLRTYQNLAAKPDAAHVPGNWARNVVRWRWFERARAWDDEVQARRDEVALKYQAMLEARKMRSLAENWRLAQRLRARVDLMLRHPLSRRTTDDGKNVTHPTRWNFGHLLKAAEFASNLESMVYEAASRSIDQLTRAEKDAVLRAAEEVQRAELEAAGEIDPDATDPP